MACPGCDLLERLRIDDPVGCVPTHGLAGIWGLVSVAFFAEKDILENKFSGEFGIFKGGPWRFLGVQLLMTVAVVAWAACTTFLELQLVNRLLGLRMSLEEELLGADKVEHGIEPQDPKAKEEPIIENGHENPLETIEENVTSLETVESQDKLTETENELKESSITICTRRK